MREGAGLAPPPPPTKQLWRRSGSGLWSARDVRGATRPPAQADGLQVCTPSPAPASCPAAALEWGGLTADLGTILLRAPPQRNPHINSVRATVPYVPSVQPSMVVLTTADPPISKLEPQYPPPLPPKHHRRRKQVCIPPFAFLFHRVAWVTKPHPSPPHRPPRWSLPTTTLCSAETDPNSPRCPCHPPCPPMLSKDDTPEPAVFLRFYFIRRPPPKRARYVGPGICELGFRSPATYGSHVAHDGHPDICGCNGCALDPIAPP